MALYDKEDFNPDTEPHPIVIQPLHDGNALTACAVAAEGHSAPIGSASVIHEHPHALIEDSADNNGIYTTVLRI